jgi:hypothetical protein
LYHQDVIDHHIDSVGGTAARELTLPLLTRHAERAFVVIDHPLQPEALEPRAICALDNMPAIGGSPDISWCGMVIPRSAAMRSSACIWSNSARCAPST